MLKFVLLKMRNKRWLMLALLIGNILLLSITGSNVMYTHAALQRSLTQDLNDHMVQTGNYPGLVTITTSNSPKKNQVTRDAAVDIRKMGQTLDLPSLLTVEHYTLGEQKATPLQDRENGMRKSVTLSALRELDKHSTLVAGRFYSPTPNPDGSIDVMVSQQAMVSLDVLLDECFTISKLTGPDGQPLLLRVCGVFRNSAEDDLYWVNAPSSFRTECFMHEDLFEPLFITGNDTIKLTGKFYAFLDYTAITVDDAQTLAEASETLYNQYARTLGISYNEDFRVILQDFLTVQRQVTTTLWLLQIPIFVLLAAFIFMVSKQILDMEQGEIAVLKSRGASRFQIITTYLTQSLLLSLLSAVIAIPLSIFLVQVVGSSNAFLEFVQRKALPISFSWDLVALVGIAMLLAVGCMVLPVFRHAKVTIVNHMQRKHRKNDAPLWQKLFLDVVLLGVSIYGLYSFNNQKVLLSQRVLEGTPLDPLLFVSSSLFMLGAGLLALRILPAITFLIFRLFKKWWSPALYAAFLRVIRSRFSQGFIMFFLVLTVALGIFSAQTARTINANKEDAIRYTIGADVVMREDWIVAYDGMTGEPIKREPDFPTYKNLSGTASAAKVWQPTDYSIHVEGKKVEASQLMAIHTKTFGETAVMKEGLLNHHFYEYLNALGSVENGVLLSRSFETDFDLKLGDIFRIVRDSRTYQFVICGFVDYWPSFEPMTYVSDEEGYREVTNYLVVTNLDHLQQKWGVEDYDIWLRVKDSTDYLYDYFTENGTKLYKFTDATNDVVRMKNDPMIQGTNGILTVGFVVVLLVCSTGFLIYWILSIRSRSLQFSIYRAMGMTLREVLTMLLCEQLFISGTAVASGVGVGFLTSKLYMPLIQMAYGNSASPLPLEVVTQQQDMLQLFLILGAVMLLCLVILGWIISRMKIAQALKLGED